MASKSASSEQSSVSENKLNYERRKQIERDLRKIGNEITRVENDIATLEKSIAEKHDVLNDPGVQNLDYDAVSKEIVRLNRDLDLAMEKWEKLHQKQEELSAVVNQ
jgi:ATP-binding cassette subfamily F protein 3